MKDSIKVKAYDRAVEKLMLKNCKQSTTVKVASAKTVKQPEIMFGTQKVGNVSWAVYCNYTMLVCLLNILPSRETIICP
jgi:hypothetical protein